MEALLTLAVLLWKSALWIAILFGVLVFLYLAFLRGHLRRVAPGKERVVNRWLHQFGASDEAWEQELEEARQRLAAKEAKKRP